ncbi:hypothetical protein GCM10007389_39960 [Pontibacter akesuensis]|nr:hypothetical protein GCM10007389_39960 [Pontibacter akesuensis]
MNPRLAGFRIRKSVRFAPSHQTPSHMNELREFLSLLNACDLIVLTLVSTDRLYCRFFLGGLYM